MRAHEEYDKFLSCETKHVALKMNLSRARGYYNLGLRSLPKIRKPVIRTQDSLVDLANAKNQTRGLFQIKERSYKFSNYLR